MSRKAVFDQFTTSHLKEFARNDYWDGPGWGEATSRPIRVKQYLSEELTQKILTRLEELRQEWKAKLDAVPKSKRFVGKTGFLIDGLYNGCSGGFRDKKDCEVLEVAGKMLYASALATGWFKNGRYWASLRESVDKMPIDFGYYVNRAWIGNGRYTSEQDNFRIYWDSENKRFYTIEFKRVHTDPIPYEEHKRNWRREGKRAEFTKKFLALARQVATECGTLNVDLDSGKISACRPEELTA